MGRREGRAASTWVVFVGWASVWALAVTAATGLWLEYVYAPDATSAWDSIEVLQAQIRRGLLVADAHRVWSVLAVGATAAWFGLTLALRHPVALVVGLAFCLSLLGRLTAAGSASTGSTLFEAAAAGSGLIAVLFWHLAPRVARRTIRGAASD